MDEHGSNPSPDVDESAGLARFSRRVPSDPVAQGAERARHAATYGGPHASVVRDRQPAQHPHGARAGTRDDHAAGRAAGHCAVRAAGRQRGAAAPFSVTSDADSLLQSSAPAVVDPRVRTVLQYVESRHVNSACRLDDVAKNLRVSRSYLSRLVFKETGVTFNRHLQLARMNTAARLLQESELSIKEISSGTGYEHVPSFDRQFRSHFNLHPWRFPPRHPPFVIGVRRVVSRFCATPSHARHADLRSAARATRALRAKTEPSRYRGSCATASPSRKEGRPQEHHGVRPDAPPRRPSFSSRTSTRCAS